VDWFDRVVASIPRLNVKMSTSPSGVLFVVENDYFPRDARVYNECRTVAESHRCYVLAPRGTGERFIERLDVATCYRFPHFEADSVRTLPLEYALAAFWMWLLTPFLILRHGIRVVHVANPPDFIIPLIAWTRWLGTRFIFDVHDLSVETFKGKGASRTRVGHALIKVLQLSADLSTRLADAIVTTNESIAKQVGRSEPHKKVLVVRNSNPIRYRSLEEVQKSASNGAINIGYFGVLANDEAAGLDNLVSIARRLQERKTTFRVEIVGSGPGLDYLRRAVERAGMEQSFVFHGYVGLPQAFELIKNFDFGVVSWGYLEKNHVHTAMKVMDYMCCAVPVCSLNLTEQLRSTGGIGVHADSFEVLADSMLEVYGDQARYQDLRSRTLERFNGRLSWEYQKQALMEAYVGLG
jgi:glycosyltransferase involved in cell wall biosynthesis